VRFFTIIPQANSLSAFGVGSEALGASELGMLFQQTDAALYRAKRAGGNQVVSGPLQFNWRCLSPKIDRSPRRSAKLFAPLHQPL
jgi:hypothetical protein